MTCNVGKTDRAVRFVAGALILAVGFYFQSWWGLLGLVPITTGLMRWCPAYVPLKINSNKRN